MDSRFFLLSLCVSLMACELPGRPGTAADALPLVGEWSSARRGDTAGETIIFAHDRSVVLRDGNTILRTSAPVPSGGMLQYEVDETADPDHLDFVILNAAGEPVARIPGIVKVLTDDQVQLCMDPETLTRPADFNGRNCAVLTKLTGQPGPMPEQDPMRERDPMMEEADLDPEPAYEPPARTPSNVAYVNSPGDGFLALRSEPSVQTGRRVRKIPHEAQVEIVTCRSSASVVGSTRGYWCQVRYNGISGWAFDAFLTR
jgi:hypothetical protein